MLQSAAKTFKIVTLPPGKYIVGDLCYRHDEEWDQMVSNYAPNKLLKLSDGRKYVILKTAYGDGSYLDQDGKEYFVDSGTIGIMEYSEEMNSPLGRTFDFYSDFNVYNDNGVLHFGAMYIDTQGELDYDSVEEEEHENA